MHGRLVVERAAAVARIQEFDPNLAERLVVVPAISPVALDDAVGWPQPCTAGGCSTA